ncbi:MAG: adenylate kinase [Ndongobacter sp.]|nr:adenylate kinase [Ndongobacter sp.]
MRFVLLGPPGAGKGTQASILEEKYGVVHISTGDIFRSNIKNETELGKKVKEYLAAGALVPDELTIDLVWDRLNEDDCVKGFLLDGFPRTLAQAKALDERMKECELAIDYALNFTVPNDVLIRRLAGRRVCPECGSTFHIDNHPSGVCDECGSELIQREDDTEQVIRDRIKVYETQTAPLVDYYRQQGCLISVDGTRPVADVTQAIVAAIN